jgi:predicted helicase
VIARRLEIDVTTDDMLAYIAALAAHPSYTSHFAEQLKTPGVRLPLSADPLLWAEAVALGRKIIWLHTYGERFTDQASGRPKGPPRLSEERRPRVVKTIPDTTEQMPEKISYNPATETLHVGAGEIRPVPQSIWEYEVSGMRVVRRWFDYRKQKPRRKRTSPLDDVNATEWSHLCTTELLDLLSVLSFCVELEPQQANLLDRVCAGPMITVADLKRADVLPPPKSAQVPPAPCGSDALTFF